METALITGASSGIGLHLARQFAQHGHPVILTAPVESELQSIAQEFRNKFNVTVRVIAKDLEEPKAAQEIFEELQASNVEIDILVNNAGHGFQGEWWELSIDQDLSMLRLNIEAALRLTKLFLPPMIQRGSGRILNTASVAGFEPYPLLATYAATKAFVLSWSEALATELEETPIRVTALCPGVTDADFFDKADAEGMRARQSSNVMAPQDVAKAGYDGMINEELFVIPGIINKAMVAARRLLSVKSQAKINEKMDEKVPSKDQTRHRGDEEFKSSSK
ncbi:MAG TPA: SDR family oxidoreductase [Terrimicrobiaceae bacterium]